MKLEKKAEIKYKTDIADAHPTIANILKKICCLERADVLGLNDLRKF